MTERYDVHLRLDKARRGLVYTIERNDGGGGWTRDVTEWHIEDNAHPEDRERCLRELDETGRTMFDRRWPR